MTTHDIVGKLWNLCNVLKDDGVTYHQYVTELTTMLFLKMAEETGTESQIPAGYRWEDLEAQSAPERLEFYKVLLIHLGSHGSTLVNEIFGNASSFIKKPATLSTVKTNVLFFTRGENDRGNTREVWVYDLRANMPLYGKRTALMREHFAAFEVAFGNDSTGSAASLAKRVDTREAGRLRRFTREQIAARGDSLDIAWLKDDSGGSAADLPEPAVLAMDAMAELEGALDKLRGVLEELGEEVDA